MINSKQYAINGGTHCPVCNSADIADGHHETDSGTVSVDVTCAACGAEWTDLYILSGYTGLKKGTTS